MQDNGIQPIEIDEDDDQEEETELPEQGHCNFCNKKVKTGDDSGVSVFEYPNGSGHYYFVCYVCSGLLYGTFRIWLSEMLKENSEFAKLNPSVVKQMGIV